MFNFIKKFCEARLAKKQQKTQIAKEKAFKKEMQSVYRFLKWIEGQFPNRKARKQFYMDIYKNGAIHCSTIEKFMNSYIPEKDK